ncbi:flavin reductase [Corynebacterium yudongzhengii]|uniref:Flavin reductase n=1 Tax=Corynebacterium yudongzhengii TaxID=2080740 RepID=A0A2U1T636_9CORY|nr:flavin reductase family protein [Corynebacterium yudongzhengii]AWB82005.1 flavin reductase [Corynebacterium yudongzhengii]PWC01467.1 flavin reductase [Corynebacterium yudongzhengii]
MTSTSLTQSLDLRAAYSHIPTSLVALAAEVDGERVGMTVGSFVTQSMEPPLVTASIKNSSSTWPVLRTAWNIGISVLNDDHLHLARQLAGPGQHRFDGVRTTRHNDALFIDGAGVALDTRLVDDIVIGDHTVAVFEVIDLHAAPSGAPLIFHNRQIKPAA